MYSSSGFFRGFKATLILVPAVLFLSSSLAWEVNFAGLRFGNVAVGQEAPGPQKMPQQKPQPGAQATPQTEAQPEAEPSAEPPAKPVVFQKPIASGQLTFLVNYDGRSSSDVLRDHMWHKLTHDVVPDTLYHYGVDKPLEGTLEEMLKDSPLPVQVSGSRYVTISSRRGSFKGDRGFLWVEMQEGIALGVVYFHPTNGEPTPTLTVFSKQLKDESIGMSQLPAAFYQDLTEWAAKVGIEAITTRYFINAAGKKNLLVHDEDFCTLPEGVTVPSQEDCEQMNADAADIDMQAAYFLAQTGYASNATAGSEIDAEQDQWIIFRDDTCSVGVDRLRCRIRLTRNRTRILMRPHRGRSPIPNLSR